MIKLIMIMQFMIYDNVDNEEYMFYWRIEATAYTKVDCRPKGVSSESRNIIISLIHDCSKADFKSKSKNI
jgi:hypothetical protein